MTIIYIVLQCLVWGIRMNKNRKACKCVHHLSHPILTVLQDEIAETSVDIANLKLEKEPSTTPMEPCTPENKGKGEELH
jgi:hypothetical protein